MSEQDDYIVTYVEQHQHQLQLQQPVVRSTLNFFANNTQGKTNRFLSIWFWDLASQQVNDSGPFSFAQGLGNADREDLEAVSSQPPGRAG
jgi:hypothetical protein